MTNNDWFVFNHLLEQHELSASITGGIWLVHLPATLFMTGVIWLVQLVHYPLYMHIGRDAFVEYETRHTQLIFWIVAPGMVLESITAVLLFWFGPVEMSQIMWWFGVGLLFVIWMSTARVQMPCHHRLLQGYDDATVTRLISTNWVRTIAWSMRSLLLLWITARMISV
jgi:uncharacterized membrane protein